MAESPSRTLFVNLTVPRGLGRRFDGTLPYAFQYLPPPPPVSDDAFRRNFATLRIVAAPGVRIDVVDSKDERVGLLGPAVPALDIIRVQDIALVPSLGRDISSNDYLYTNWVNPDPRSAPALSAPSAVRFERLPNGVSIVQELYRRRVDVRVRTIGSESGLDAFAHRLDQRNGQSVLSILSTPGVTISFTTAPTPFAMDAFAGAADRISVQPVEASSIGDFLDKVSLFQSPAFVDVPGLVTTGRILDPLPVGTWEEDIGVDAFEAAVGFIPIVGDLYDVAQFVYGVATDRDFHGRPVSRSQIAFMGAAMLLPFVSKGTLKLGAELARRQLRRAFGQKADTAAEALSAASAARSELKVTGALEASRADSAIVVQALTKASQAERTPVRIQALLNADGTGFSSPVLQARYAEYVAIETAKLKRGARKDGQEIAKPEAWTKLTRSPEAVQALESLLGKDFRTVERAAERARRSYRNASDIIRPTSLTQARAQELQEAIVRSLDELIASKKIKWEKVVDGRIPDDMIGEVVGKIGEILAEPIKEAALKVRKTTFHQSVKRYEGVKIQFRTMKKVPGGVPVEEFMQPLEFTDGIIAVVHGGRIQITDVFEVKAGNSVAAKAQNQIFEWIEDQPDEGFRLLLPDGQSFTYVPDAVGDKAIVGMASGERHVILPSGKSHLGIRSGEQITAKVSRSELPATGQEIHYLASILPTLIKEQRFKESAAQLDFVAAQTLLSVALP